MTKDMGLYIVPDEPEPPPLQGSVSQPVSALGKASAPLRECPFCGGEPTEVMSELGSTVISCHRRDCNITAFTSAWTHREEAVKAWNRRDGEAARVAEAVAALEAIEDKRYFVNFGRGDSPAWVLLNEVIAIVKGVTVTHTGAPSPA
jgi:hypothetical protein